MKDTRSGSQILYGFLPQQTGDLRGGIYRTVEWKDPLPVDVDDAIVRRRLTEQLTGWAFRGDDAGIAGSVRRGGPIEVIQLNPDRGVRVERFPNVYVCRMCRTVEDRRDRPCPSCAATRAWDQLHFVGYHECGFLEPPSIPRCPTHHLCRMPYQKSMDASRIRFECPVCGRLLRQGMGFRKCPCGRAWNPRRSPTTLIYNVHRASTVYTPQTFTLINPRNRSRMAEVTDAGGPRRALAWAIDGFRARKPGIDRQTTTSTIDGLLAMGFDRETAERTAAFLAASGKLAPEEDIGMLADAPASRIEVAEREAVDIALATIESRVLITDLIRPETPDDARRVYETEYPPAIRRAGLEAIDLVDKFPVLRAVYGYTRGGQEPGKSKLNLFSGRRGTRIYADPQDSEALMFRLDPLRVHSWLTRRGHSLPPAADSREARAALAASVIVPDRFADESGATPAGRDLIELVHTYAHRAIRQLSVFAGVDRESLGEYLVPSHGVFFVYAATRGDFVLGGVQAVFENDLHHFLTSFMSAETRCALDPACRRHGGACHACLHLGEPVCERFNHYLDRAALFGHDGYLATHE
ncbi:hypothetical protein [Micromonospora sp. URMC 103]|uniref:hypothetical protein n=1 Tax=Micromonospora sp. URMC 103 TaxID=3423406 RepID=UPI003F1973D1